MMELIDRLTGQIVLSNTRYEYNKIGLRPTIGSRAKHIALTTYNVYSHSDTGTDMIRAGRNTAAVVLRRTKSFYTYC